MKNVEKEEGKGGGGGGRLKIWYILYIQKTQHNIPSKFAKYLLPSQSTSTVTVDET